MRSKLAVLGATVAVAALVTTAPVAVEAAGQITGKQIKNSSITGKDVKTASLKGSDIGDGTLSGADLADGSVTGADLGAGSVTGAQVADGSISGADVADGSLRAGDFAPGELPSVRAYQTDAQPGVTVGTAQVAVATLALPQAGTYMVTSKVWLNNNSTNTNWAHCTLTDGVISDTGYSGLDGDAGEDDYRIVGALLATTVTGPTTITYSCDSLSGNVEASDARIVAIKVAGLN